MNDNVDVLKELEVKNKEIYLNNLNANLSSNLENILLIIDEKFKIQSEELLIKINSILGRNINKDEINKFMSSLLEKIKSLLVNRFNLFKEYISNIDNQKYNELLSEEKNVLLTEFDGYYNSLSFPLLQSLLKGADEFIIMRLSYYINTIFFEKLLVTIKDTISVMDQILCNNYQVDYERFKKINENTIKKV